MLMSESLKGLKSNTICDYTAFLCAGAAESLCSNLRIGSSMNR